MRRDDTGSDSVTVIVLMIAAVVILGGAASFLFLAARRDAVADQELVLVNARTQLDAEQARAAADVPGGTPGVQAPPADEAPADSGLIPPRRLDVVADPPEAVVSWERAHEHLGRTITAEGTVVRTHNSGRACFLNFAEDWQGRFHCVIFPDLFDAFPDAPEKWFLGKAVRVTGTVQEHRGAPQIVIDAVRQIEVVD